MKATDLQIGDAIYDEIGRVIRVDSIDRLFISYEYYESGNYGECIKRKVSISEINPIPLTAEILEKNGFKIGHHGTYHLWGFHIGNHYEGSFTPYIDIGYATRNLSYVHELQHALRICGFDELATNFKIED